MTDKTAQIKQLMAERILVLDGAMGTMIQSYKLEEEDYRGERFSEHPCDVKGNNDLLSLTRPDIIKAIHGAYFDAGADIVETNTFNSTSIAMADYQMEDLVYDLNKEGAALARSVADEFEEKNWWSEVCRWSPWPNKPHLLDISRRKQPRLSECHLSRTGRVLYRGITRVDRWWCRSDPGRNHFRYSECQGGIICYRSVLPRSRH